MVLNQINRDNLRGARFEATLDGSWHVQGSLEELQGLPGAWDAVAMTTATAMPGWGRAKVLSDGRVDVARARVSSTRIQGLGDQDTLFWTAAYAPFHWGNLPSPLSFASTAASFPRGGLDWQHQDQLRIGLHAGRWTGTERSELGGSTESLFRQSDELGTPRVDLFTWNGGRSVDGDDSATTLDWRNGCRHHLAF